MREDRPRAVVEGRQRRGDGARGDGRQGVALVGGLGGGNEGVGQGPPAEALDQLRPRVDGAGHIDGERSPLGHGVVAGCSDVVNRQGGGGAAAAVEAVKPALAGIPDERERVAAQAAGVAVDDGQHRVRGDRRVHGAAAGAERLDARSRGQGVRRDDHAVGGGDRRHRRRP